MKNSLRSMAIVLTLIFTLNGTALAAPTNDKLNQQSDSLTKIQAQREEIQIKIEKSDDEIQKSMAKTEENKIKISETEKAIEKSSAEIKQVEKKAQKEQELFNSRMRVLYINGFDSYTNIILESESFGDFVSRVENIKTIVQFDKKVVDEFEATKKELDDKQITLNKTKDVLLALNVEDKKKLDKIIATKEEQTKLIAELNGKDNVLPSGTSSSQSVSESMTKINQISKSEAKYTPSRGSANLSSNAVIAYASKFLGTPYLWGGTTPSGFDCSGFTQYVYSHFGISIGRTTFDQINDGAPVARNNLQTGDLVLFGSVGNPHHVGIYIGDNTYIHAPSTGDVIKVSDMTRSDFIIGRRVK
ncbi:C40 family peptidase [Clostridium bowmanii]|uniref:C40 family peptidase n=1 Tax=Clostridium bowmanii TaxID=132925 RepID=UPI001C0DB6B7|nr:C40 family peptidase [Clostridium bowmanii]MBU3191400.1 C40 family peptidase [Clostridium bowmanii]MCA1075755.1 C40 family peptidase [Clostridium bowmanii]